MEEKKEEVKDDKKKTFICCLCCLIKKCIVFFVPGFVVALIIFVIINASLVPTSKPEFCGEVCHTEMAEAYESWKKSPHAKNSLGIEIKCIECHLPPKDKYFTHLAAKAYTGTKDAYHHIVGTEYDAEAIREEVREHMTNDVCLRCHKNLKDAVGNEVATEMHNEMVFEVPEGEEVLKCIECHEDAGHVRE